MAGRKRAHSPTGKASHARRGKRCTNTNRSDDDPDSACAAAAAAVLMTTELLERILIDIDMQTLLPSQRVSRNWRDAINKNQSLQKKLFMRPATRDEGVLLAMQATDGKVLVPYIGGGFCDFSRAIMPNPLFFTGPSIDPRHPPTTDSFTDPTDRTGGNYAWVSRLRSHLHVAHSAGVPHPRLMGTHALRTATRSLL